jgi:putative hydrolase of the HAD superfamily
VLAELPGRPQAPKVVASAANRVLSPSTYRCYADAIPHLTALRRAGVPLALVSNFDDFLFPVLHHLGLGATFDVVCTSYRTGASKPSPEPFRYSLERLGLAPAQVVMVGDSPAEDMAGAATLGIPAVLIDRHGINQGYRDGPRVTSFTELPEAIPGYPLLPDGAGPMARERREGCR